MCSRARFFGAFSEPSRFSPTDFEGNVSPMISISKISERQLQGLELLHDFLGKLHERDFCCELRKPQSQRGANHVRILVANPAITEKEWHIFLFPNINHCQTPWPVSTLHPLKSSLFSAREIKQSLTEQTLRFTAD